MNDQPPPSAPPSVRRRVVVHGRVQGVFFRATVRDEAQARGVTGWVRNRSDGTVEAVFEGEPRAVAECIAFCRTGPPGAAVDEVEIHDEMPLDERGFRIAR